MCVGVGVQGIGVLDVVVLQRGEAVVVFNTVMDQHMALQRDRYKHTHTHPSVLSLSSFL